MHILHIHIYIYIYQKHIGSCRCFHHNDACARQMLTSCASCWMPRPSSTIPAIPLSNKPTEKCMEMDKIVKKKTTGIKHKSVNIGENITSRPWINKLCRHRDRTWNLQGKHDPLEAVTLAPRFFHKSSCCVFRCFSSAQDKETPKVLDLQALAVFKPLTYGLSIVPFLKATARCRGRCLKWSVCYPKNSKEELHLGTRRIQTSIYSCI